MASSQFSTNDARLSDPQFVLRPSYSSLSDSVRRASLQGQFGSGRAYARVVDSVSCRQMYLRSYTFSRKESVAEKTKKYIGEVKKKVSGGFGLRKVRSKDDQTSCSALLSTVCRILTCASRMDVANVDRPGYF